MQRSLANAKVNHAEMTCVDKWRCFRAWVDEWSNSNTTVQHAHPTGTTQVDHREVQREGSKASKDHREVQREGRSPSKEENAAHGGAGHTRRGRGHGQHEKAHGHEQDHRSGDCEELRMASALHGGAGSMCRAQVFTGA